MSLNIQKQKAFCIQETIFFLSIPCTQQKRSLRKHRKNRQVLQHSCQKCNTNAVYTFGLHLFRFLQRRFLQRSLGTLCIDYPKKHTKLRRLPKVILLELVMDLCCISLKIKLWKIKYFGNLGPSNTLRTYTINSYRTRPWQKGEPRHSHAQPNCAGCCKGLRVTDYFALEWYVVVTYQE